MSSLSSLPEEIQVVIFLRLPVNSVLACRCVCKIWLKLLCNPRFIKNHTDLTIHNNPRLMFGDSMYGNTKNPTMKSISIDYNSISSSSELNVDSMDYPCQNKKINVMVTLGSCNGLVCFGISSGGMGIDEKNYICIWNPATGEYKNIKIQLCDFLADSMYYVRHGFGYDSKNDDYKLVRISEGGNLGYFKKFQVYSLRKKSWKTIQRTDRYMFLGHLLHKRLPGVLINGVLHWSGATATHRTSLEVIVSFDIKNERLMDIPYPEETMLPLQNRKMRAEVGMLGNCLCVVCCAIGIGTDMWVMQDYGVRQSWTKVFSITEYRILKPIWSYVNGDILVYAHKQLSLCNQNNGVTRKVLLHGLNMSRNLESYVESLVSLNSGTYVEKRTTNGSEKKPKRQRLR